MLKYVNTAVVFQEIPDEVTLSVNISNCPCRCPGCHSRYLWEDEGDPLTVEALEALLRKYGNGITCICLMGGDAEPEYVNYLAKKLHQTRPSVKVAWYSGRTLIPGSVCKTDFDYIKVGPYIAHLGGLKEATTNQRLFRRSENGNFTDITQRFWKKRKAEAVKQHKI